MASPSINFIDYGIIYLFIFRGVNSFQKIFIAITFSEYEHVRVDREFNEFSEIPSDTIIIYIYI